MCGSSNGSRGLRWLAGSPTSRVSSTGRSSLPTPSRRAASTCRSATPPGYGPTGRKTSVLAEHDPWFALAHKPSTESWNRSQVHSARPARGAGQLSSPNSPRTPGVVASLGSGLAYPLLAGTQPDLYRAFMCQVWSHQSPHGTSGMIHPDTHFGGVKEGALRAAAYRHLRVHGHSSTTATGHLPTPSRQHRVSAFTSMARHRDHRLHARTVVSIGARTLADSLIARWRRARAGAEIPTSGIFVRIGRGSYG